MDNRESLLLACCVHPQWHDILNQALAQIDKAYLDQLLKDDAWLPGVGLLFNAFRRDRQGVKYLLIGESPYPRRESANGIAFYDAAVGELWSDKGMSTAVNRATSMRNIIKTALLAEGHLSRDSEGKIGQQLIAAADKQALVQTMEELFANLQRAGFLMLNATPVLHPGRKPAQEAVYWQGFLQQLLASLAEQAESRITLVLWGKIAEALLAMPASGDYDKLVCEHPYNISFIDNPAMLQLFAELRLLQKSPGI
mgnify:FL=1